MGKQVEMKMAKASEDDVQRLVKFMEFLETYVEEGVDNRDPEIDDPPQIDDEAAMDIIREEFSRFTRRANVMGSWRRIVWGFSVLADNCCDPDSNVLEWSADLRKLIESSESPALEVHPFAADALQLQSMDSVQ